MTSPYKSGFQTSEFWVTIFGMVASFLVSKGIITVDQVDPLLKSIIAIYQGLIAAIAIYQIAKAYIDSRHQLKQTMLEQSTQSTVSTGNETVTA